MSINLIYLIVLILGFPTGLILAKLCKEEIKAWKKRLLIISIMSIILSIIISFIPLQLFLYKFPVIISLLFIIITCLTIIWKSEKRKK